MFCHRDASSQGRHVQDFSFGDTPVGDEITLNRPYTPPPKFHSYLPEKFSRLSSRRARIKFCIGKKELNLYWSPGKYCIRPLRPGKGGAGDLDKILLFLVLVVTSAAAIGVFLFVRSICAFCLSF